MAARFKQTTKDSPRPFDRLAWITFGLMLALVIARGSMQEYLREPFDVTPGSDPQPRAPGPATSVGLDLLCCLPAILVLGRRAFGRSSVPTVSRSFVPLGLLTVWMLASTFWAADKFGALVTAFHWMAAVAMLWAASQLVRDWLKLRLLAAVAFGMLPMYVVQAVNFRFIEQPELIKDFEKNKDKYLHQRGIDPDSFAAKQFGIKVTSGEMFGFETSPNTLGALLAFLIIASSGLVIQRSLDFNAVVSSQKFKAVEPGAAIVGMGILAGLWIMAYARSRTAFAMVFLAVPLMIVLWRYREALVRQRKRVYLASIGIFVLGALAVVGHGLAHGSLVHSSLTFRWHYWVGAAGIFRAHPLIGIGWNNFGLHYLAHRLPIAPEEVKDPHNFLVRFITELGLVGGVLVVAWQLRMWWELARPIVPTVSSGEQNRSPGVVNFIAAVAGAGILFSTFLTVDWSTVGVDDVLIRVLFIGAIVLGGSFAGLRSLESQEPDDRPAPWLLCTMILAVGLFLINNLLDFSLFEIGPMMLFGVLAGGVLGVRQPVEPTGSRAVARVTFIASTCIVVGACLGIWLPFMRAQRAGDEGDELIRTGQLTDAASRLADADRAAWRLNSDYPFRAAKAAMAVSSPSAAYIDQAIRENPADDRFYRLRAAGEMRQPAPRLPAIKSDYDTAVGLDPNNVPLHLEYAATLEKLGDRKGALSQYEAALRYDDLLEKVERKRMTREEIADIHKKMVALEQPKTGG